jgi:hypothetical protein
MGMELFSLRVSKFPPCSTRYMVASCPFCALEVGSRRPSATYLWTRALASTPMSLVDSAEYWRSLGVVFVRKDLVGSKREMSPNRARHEFYASPFATCEGQGTCRHSIACCEVRIRWDSSPQPLPALTIRPSAEDRNTWKDILLVV